MSVLRDKNKVVIHCFCGTVELMLRGKPIASAACYCDTCQEGSCRIEALPNAPAVRERDGGTAYVLYRKDRVTVTTGSKLLKYYQLEENDRTNRVVASCCNSALLMRFDDARHWIPVYRARFAEPPPVQMRICTSFMPQSGGSPSDVPSHRMYSGALMMRLLSSRVAMLFDW